MMSEDFAWFKENYGNLQEKYGDSFIAIKDRRVLGIYSSYADAVRNTQQAEPLGSFIVQECRTDREAYHASIVSMNFC